MHLINDGLPFLTTELAPLRLTKARLRSLVSQGVVRPVFRGVAVDARVADNRLLRCQSLSLVCPDGGVVGLSSATWVWGVDTLPPSRRGSMVAEFLVPHHSTRQLRRGVKTIECCLNDDDLEEVHGVRLTVPGRTAVDLLRRQFRPYALSSADSLHRAGLVELEDVRRRVIELKGYPGIVQARTLAPMIDGRRESPGESWTFLRIVDAGFPWPTPQIPLVDRHGRELYWIDLGYRELKVGAEFDGREFHSADDQQHDEDRREDMGWRFGWRIAVATYELIMGDNAEFEWQLGRWLNVDPLPRLW